MDRRDNDRYDRNNYGLDYGRYEGYSRNDDHYHSARNLTDEFERDYRHERGWDSDRDLNRPHTYHEGGYMGSSFDQYRRDRGDYGDNSGNRDNDRDRNRDYYGNFNSGHDRHRIYQNDYRADQGRYSGNRSSGQGQQNNRRQGYMMSYYDGTFGRFDESDNNRRGSGNDYYSGSGNNYGSSGYNDSNYTSGGDYHGRDRDRSYGSSAYGTTYRNNRDNRSWGEGDYDRNWEDDNRWRNSDRWRDGSNRY